MHFRLAFPMSVNWFLCRAYATVSVAVWRGGGAGEIRKEGRES